MWNEDYKDMLCALVDESVDFILVGAYALAAHGFPRATVDIDLWVRPSPDNAEKVYKALARFGAPLSEVSTTDFEKEDAVVQIGVAPRRIDFVTGVSGLTYDEASRGAIARDIDGVRVRILSMPDIIRNKLASGRPKDLEDVKTLQKYIDESSGK
jgi:predicted nucleotidyltransferase